MDRACVEEHPVDCIYEGGRSLYIQRDECVDCGASVPLCSVEAIYYEDDLPEDLMGVDQRGVDGVLALLEAG
jgi:NAD-dependent dihydropyrimidine dehydrogenase PreA subunit